MSSSRSLAGGARRTVPLVLASLLCALALSAIGARPASAAIPRCAVPGGGYYVPASVKPPDLVTKCFYKATYRSHGSTAWLSYDLAAAQGVAIKRCLRIWQSSYWYYWLNLSTTFPYYTGYLPGPVNIACFVKRWEFVVWV